MSVPAEAKCCMCSVLLVVEESWLFSIIWPDFAMTLVTCMGDVCMAKADMVRRRAAEVPRAPRPDGFDQRAVDAIKERMTGPQRMQRPARRTRA